jgi:hypothetical protein
VLIFHTVHVVSIEAVTIRCGSMVFQAKEVNGANWEFAWPFVCYDRGMLLAYVPSNLLAKD